MRIFCMISLWRYMVAKLRKAAFRAHYILCICMCVRTCVVQSDERRSCFKLRFLVSIEQFFQVIYVVNISVDSLIHLYLPYQVKREVNLCDKFIAINILFIYFQHLCVFKNWLKWKRELKGVGENVIELISNKCQR